MKKRSNRTFLPVFNNFDMSIFEYQKAVKTALLTSLRNQRLGICTRSALLRYEKQNSLGRTKKRYEQKSMPFLLCVKNMLEAVVTRKARRDGKL